VKSGGRHALIKLRVFCLSHELEVFLAFTLFIAMLISDRDISSKEPMAANDSEEWDVATFDQGIIGRGWKYYL